MRRISAAIAATVATLLVASAAHATEYQGSIAFSPQPASKTDGGPAYISYTVALKPGDVLQSPNRQYIALQQSDGNLCVYWRKGTDDSAPRTAVKCTRGVTAGAGSYELWIQGDGNLCTYRITGARGFARAGTQKDEIWCALSYSPNDGVLGYTLRLGDDGNLEFANNSAGFYSRLWAFFPDAWGKRAQSAEAAAYQQGLATATSNALASCHSENLKRYAEIKARFDAARQNGPLLDADTKPLMNWFSIAAAWAGKSVDAARYASLDACRRANGKAVAAVALLPPLEAYAACEGGTLRTVNQLGTKAASVSGALPVDAGLERSIVTQAQAQTAQRSPSLAVCQTRTQILAQLSSAMDASVQVASCRAKANADNQRIVQLAGPLVGANPPADAKALRAALATRGDTLQKKGDLTAAACASMATDAASQLKMFMGALSDKTLSDCNTQLAATYQWISMRWPQWKAKAGAATPDASAQMAQIERDMPAYSGFVANRSYVLSECKYMNDQLSAAKTRMNGVGIN